MLLIAIVRWESMDFARQASAAVVLVTATLILQCAGMAVLIHWVRARIATGIKGLGPVGSAVLMVRFTTLMIVLHILQILLWAGFYRWHCLPSWEACFYFSAASFSTVGYGDVVLPRVWRLMGPVESITGVLMCGLSASCLFAIATHMVEGESGFRQRQAVSQFDRRSETELSSITARE
jgi:voltage-gated potassium channel